MTMRWLAVCVVLTLAGADRVGAQGELRGAILQAPRALGAVAGEPFAHGAVADAKRRGGLWGGPVLAQDALDQTQPAGEAQPSIRVAVHRVLTRRGQVLLPHPRAWTRNLLVDTLNPEQRVR